MSGVGWEGLVFRKHKVCVVQFHEVGGKIMYEVNPDTNMILQMRTENWEVKGQRKLLISTMTLNESLSDIEDQMGSTQN